MISGTKVTVVDNTLDQLFYQDIVILHYLKINKQI